MSNLKAQWNASFQQVGIKPISMDTAARIFAIIYAFDREEITHSPNLCADIEYIQSEYNVRGGLTPNAEFCNLFKKYALCVEDDKGKPAQWAKDIMKNVYDINI